MTFTAHPHKARPDAESEANNREQIRLFIEYLVSRVGITEQTYQEGFLGVAQ